MCGVTPAVPIAWCSFIAFSSASVEPNENDSNAAAKAPKILFIAGLLKKIRPYANNDFPAESAYHTEEPSPQTRLSY
jgi:hypothetical protein